MPTYEYVCTDCKQKFDFFMTLKEKESGTKPSCPNCKTKNVVQVFGRITIMNSSSGSSSSSMPGCGPVCGPGTC